MAAIASPPVSLTGDGRLAITRVLISVYDKTGLIELAQALTAVGVSIVSTGSTAQKIADAGIAVTPVEEITGFPECFDGRVKTLHPRVHAGILADRRRPEHVTQLAELDVAPFDAVVVNLYPFADTVVSGAGPDACVEQIDIGGPSMLRAAAKNHPSVAVVTDPADYSRLIDAATGTGFTLADRQQLAAHAFAHTAAYDTAVARWFATDLVPDSSTWPPYLGLALERSEVLRYGENPHQRAALYVDQQARPGIAQATVLHGKAMSFNNYVDADSALRAAYDFDDPAVAIIKHANPCGMAVSSSGIAAAHAAAHACDPVSAFGGVIAANREVDLAMAQQVAEVFTEVVVAPSFADDALELLQTKKNVRLLELPEGYQRDEWEWRQVSGGVLAQVGDTYGLADAGADPYQWQLVSGDAVDASTVANLVFAWRAVRAVKSNAILLAHDQATVGIGMGQVNRVDSCRLAVSRAGADRARGSVAASDAFFPFADGLHVLIDAGVCAVVQPGGSMRDDEVIEAAQAAGITMYLTGARHFAH